MNYLIDALTNAPVSLTASGDLFLVESSQRRIGAIRQLNRMNVETE